MTQEQLSKIAPKLSIDIETLNSLFTKYELNTPERIAGFMSNCSHESCGFTAKTENLNYSAQSLRKVFGKYYKTDADANSHARKPEKIANKVYANRIGNGDENSGDGWKFRGRGFIQLTGKANYEGFAKSINKSLDETISYLETNEGALESALYFWKRENCNSYCDKNDLKGLCKRINGGFNGLEDRINKFNKFISVLK